MARILIIDDDQLVRAALVLLLEHNDYEVIEAANGKEALAIIRVSRPDLVVTDIIMPEMEGFETIQTIRKVAPELKIIAMSGAAPIGSKDILMFASELGAHDFISKPIDRHKFLSSISRLLAAG